MNKTQNQKKEKKPIPLISKKWEEFSLADWLSESTLSKHTIKSAEGNFHLSVIKNSYIYTFIKALTN